MRNAIIVYYCRQWQIECILLILYSNLLVDDFELHMHMLVNNVLMLPLILMQI